MSQLSVTQVQMSDAGGRGAGRGAAGFKNERGKYLKKEGICQYGPGNPKNLVKRQRNQSSALKPQPKPEEGDSFASILPRGDSFLPGSHCLFCSVLCLVRFPHLLVLGLVLDVPFLFLTVCQSLSEVNEIKGKKKVLILSGMLLLFFSLSEGQLGCNHCCSLWGRRGLLLDTALALLQEREQQVRQSSPTATRRAVTRTCPT